MIVGNLFNAIKWGSKPPRDPLIASFLGLGGDTASGIQVTPDTAMRITAVMRAVHLISRTIASLPLFIYKRLDDGGKAKDPSHPLYPVLVMNPNKWQTRFQWWRMMVGHVLLRGNAYSLQVSTGMQGVSELIPLHPDRVTPFWAPDGSIAYAYQPLTGEQRIYLQSEILQFRDGGGDLLKGESRISQAAEALGLALAGERFAGRYFKNDATPGGIIEHPSKFKDDAAAENFKKSWQAAQGGRNRSSTAVIEHGMKYHEIGVNNKDSQFLEMRQFQIPEIARIFDIPPHKLMDLTKSSFSNIEQQAIEFVVDAIAPWLVDFEQIITKAVFTEKQSQTHLVAFVLEGRLRGDFKSRNEGYTAGRNGGWYSVNDIRRWENLNPIDGGDEYLVPLNMTPAGQVNNKASALMRDTATRMARLEANAVNRARKKMELEELLAWSKEFYASHIDKVSDALKIDKAKVTAFMANRIHRAVVVDVNETELAMELYEMGVAT